MSKLRDGPDGDGGGSGVVVGVGALLVLVFLVGGVGLVTQFGVVSGVAVLVGAVVGSALAALLVVRFLWDAAWLAGLVVDGAARARSYLTREE
jgi:hypothetical protein